MAEITLGDQDKRFQTLLDCSARFAGEHGSRKIQRFLEFVATYKNVKDIRDEQALEELGHLLTNSAHDWWLRRKRHFLNWSEALTALQNHFSRQRPAHEIYAEIFSCSFDKYILAEDFIYDKYELFHELPQPLPSERMQLDIVYALLPEEKRKNLYHINIDSLMDLTEYINDLKSDGVITQHPINTSNNTKQSNHDIRTSNQKTKEETKELEIVCDESNAQIQKIGTESIKEANESVDITLVQDRDPIIKVRRTEDLMPAIRDNKEMRTVQSQETNDKNAPPFQMASENINQIDHIINLCGNENNLPANISGLGVSITSVADASQITYLLNGETTIAPEIVTPNQQQSFVKEKKSKIRAKLCRSFGGKSDGGTNKRTKYTKLIPEKLRNVKKTNEPLPVTQSHCENMQSNTNIVITRPSIPNISNTNISQSPTASPSTTTTLTVSNHTISNTLTTKLIDPINGPFPTKATAAKMRLNAGTSQNSKCHQCGATGFYRSICPNCSPIYYYKPPNNTLQYIQMYAHFMKIAYELVGTNIIVIKRHNSINIRNIL